MLGCLFEEDSQERAEHLKRMITDSSTHADDGGKDTTAAPLPRPNSRFCGLDNRGATCYINSIIQTLALTPEFRERLMALSPEALGTLEQRDSRTRVIPLQLQRLLARLLLADRDVVSTEDLLNSFGWTCGDQDGQQHDVQELTIALLDALERSLVFTAGSNIVGDLFRGKIVRRITCSECGTVSAREEPFLDLGVATSDCEQLEEALLMHYLEDEVLDGDNKYSCVVCHHPTVAIRRTCIRRLPNILVFALMRFTFDVASERRVKNTNRFAFPFDLDMAAFVDSSPPIEDDTSYELYSVVVHRGGAHGGHYHAFIRDVDDLGNWHAAIQGDVPVGGDVSTSPGFDPDDPATVVAFILRQAGGKPATTDDLIKELNKLTGRSWSKRYRSSFGTFKKFLQSNDWFQVDDSFPYHVTLREDVSTEQQQEVVEDGPGHRWFNFDDSRVKPVTSSVLAKQFSGNECAYMLFYRRRSMLRSDDASGNPYFGVPDALVELNHVENASLWQTRETERALHNLLTVHIHLASGYSQRDGCCLVPKSGNQYLVPVAIEANTGASRVLEVLSETCTADEIDGCNILTVCRCLPAGLHLGDDLKPEWRMQPVRDGEDELRLFLWNGLTVGGQLYDVRGDEDEPLLVTVDTGPDLQFTQAFRRSTNIFIFRVLVNELLNFPPGDFYLYWERYPGREVPSNFVRLETSDDEKTLAQLGVNNLDRFFVPPVQRAISTPPNCFEVLSECTAETDAICLEDDFAEIAIEDEFQTVKKRRGSNKKCKAKNVTSAEKTKTKVVNLEPKGKNKVPGAKDTSNSDRLPEKGISISVGNFFIEK